ncbi:MAG: 1-deoxy-D-xylulose-5-phosphate reductoisomerase, partial [Clostridia bacterium]|nr:1-deoxy-D-xylulose-5-phosphate reductoisomerase [Clostridia bacterium]
MNISILGSTGSIGTQALKVADDLKGIKEINIKAISGNKNVRLLEEQARKYCPEIVAVFSEEGAKDLKVRLS